MVILSGDRNLRGSSVRVSGKPDMDVKEIGSHRMAMFFGKMKIFDNIYIQCFGVSKSIFKSELM